MLLRSEGRDYDALFRKLGWWWHGLLSYEEQSQETRHEVVQEGRRPQVRPLLAERKASIRRTFLRAAEGLEAVVDKIPDYNSEASPLPEGVGVSTEFRDRFPELRDYWEGVRAKNKGRNSHYALCTNEKGPWAWFYARGGGVHSSIVRDMCVLKCTAFSEYLSKEGECYVVYENGNFVNSAAQQAVMQ